MVEELIKDLAYIGTGLGLGLLSLTVGMFYLERHRLKNYSVKFGVEAAIKYAQKGQQKLREHKWLGRTGCVFGQGQQIALRKFLNEYHM